MKKKNTRLFELLVVGGGLWVVSGCGADQSTQTSGTQSVVRHFSSDGGEVDGGAELPRRRHRERLLVTLGLTLPAPLRRFAGDAWATRTHVEETSAVQFERLASELEKLGAPRLLIDVASRAVTEEQEHRELCLSLAEAYGVEPGPRAEAATLAPPGLPAFERCVYAAVAHCCVAETESVATLTELISAAEPVQVRNTLVRIARDEVQHSRLGWAVLTWAARQKPLAFLGRALPAMLEPGAGPLFQPAPAEADDVRLRAHGVLPLAQKRRVFTEALDGVLLPGFARAGVDAQSARDWLNAR